MRALIIEDEVKTAQYLKKGLLEHGFVVDVAHRGDDGLHLSLTGDYVIIILDVMLPDQDGWSVIAELRRSGKQTPVVFLTARDSLQDRIKGLELGGDDYVPFQNYLPGFVQSSGGDLTGTPRLFVLPTLRLTFIDIGQPAIISALICLQKNFSYYGSWHATQGRF
jgi:CheY-like chemotaxis protein